MHAVTRINQFIGAISAMMPSVMSLPGPALPGVDCLALVAAIVLGVPVSAIVNAAIAGTQMNGDFRHLLMRFVHLSPVIAGILLMIYDARRFNLRSGATGSHPAFGWRILLSPRGLSRWLFTPRGVYATEDRLIGLLGFARTVMGVTAVGVVITRYNAATLALLPGHLVIQGLNGAVVSTIVVMIAAAVLGSAPTTPPATCATPRTLIRSYPACSPRSSSGSGGRWRRFAMPASPFPPPWWGTW